MLYWNILLIAMKRRTQKRFLVKTDIWKNKSAIQRNWWLGKMESEQVDITPCQLFYFFSAFSKVSHNLCIFHSPFTLLSNRTLNYSYNPLSKTQYTLIREFKIKKRLLSTWYDQNNIKILLWIWEALFQPNVTY
jgi:hypothetical protein